MSATIDPPGLPQTGAVVVAGVGQGIGVASDLSRRERALRAIGSSIASWLAAFAESLDHQ